MFKLFCLVLLLAVDSGLGQTKEDIQEKCVPVFTHIEYVFCCNHIDEIVSKYLENFIECKSLPFEPPACDFHNCAANKIGIATVDGKIEKAKLSELVAEELSEFPGLSDSVLEKCVNGDLALYGQPDECDVRKLVSCLTVHIFRDCPDWSNRTICTAVRKEAAKCFDIFEDQSIRTV